MRRLFILTGRAQWVLPSLIAGLLVLTAACAAEPQEAPAQELRFLNWEDYIAPEALEGFQSEFGIRVVLYSFVSEEEMLAAVQSRSNFYDVVMVSDSMVATLSQLKLLALLDKKRLPNMAHIQEGFLNPPYDPDNRYSVPYLWGTTGLALNKKYIPLEANSWAVLWDPAYQGRLAMLNDPHEVVGVALKLLGYSLNSRDLQHLAAAKEKLLQQKPWLAGYFDPLTIIQKLVREELWAAQIYNGDALSAAKENPNVVYVLPGEGAALWIDNLVIPAGAPHQEAAELFINYLLRPEVSAAIANYLQYASPNQAAQAFIHPEVLENKALYPDAQSLALSEFYQPVEEAAEQEFNRIWAELQRR